MRWHIQGTDARTGQAVELAVDASEAAQAVEAAIHRQIVVRDVRPGKGRARFLVPLTLALVIAMAAVGTGLYLQNQSLRGTLNQAMADQSRTDASVSRAQVTPTPLRDSGQLAEPAATQVAQLADQLAAARSQISATQQRLADADQQMNTLRQSAQQVPGLQAQLQTLTRNLADAQQQLQASQAQATRLQTELSLQSRRIDTLQNARPPVDPVVAKVAELQKANAALSGEIDTLKAELLTLAAKPADPAPPPAAAAPVRWPLAITYDAAQAFLVLHADDTNLISHSQGDQMISTASILAANAARISILHDRPREIVYSATLSVSLAADAPADKLAENKALMLDFLHTFAGDFKTPDSVVSAAAQLTAPDDTRRMLFLGPMTKVTLWHDRDGTYIVQVEPSHGAN